MTDIVQAVERLIDIYIDELVAIRRELHAHPQVGYEETFAPSLIEKELNNLGIPYEKGIAKTGIVALIEPLKSQHSRGLALRADMDALPVKEETGLSWASKEPGMMHACGHDGHVTMLLGAARVLTSLKEHLSCPVKLIFQPAEEGGMGGMVMVQEGVLTSKICTYEVASSFALHGYPAGRIGDFYIRNGVMMAALDDVEVVLRGRGGHASKPEDTIDPVITAAHILTALQTIVSRNVSPFENAVITVAQISAGHKPNVIPETAHFTANFRSLNDATRDKLLKRFRSLVEQVASAFGCTSTVTHLLSHPATVNDGQVVSYIMEKARHFLGDSSVIEKPHSSMGSEDFSYFCDAVPSAIGYVGLKPGDRDDYPGLHNDRFDFNDAALPTGIKLLSAFVLHGDELLKKLAPQA